MFHGAPRDMKGEKSMKITHDFHVHTNLSLCAKPTATLEGYLETAKKLGLTKLGISNHFWDAAIPGANDFYVPQDYDHVASLRPAIEKADVPGLRVYFGCECEYDPWRHGVACTEEVAERFEYMLVPNSHTHMMMPKEYYHPYEKHAEFMLAAFEEIVDCPLSKYVTAMAHPFEAVACPYDNEILIDLIPDDRYRRLFAKAAGKGIAFEINISSMVKKTPEEVEKASVIRLFRLAKEEGCKFLFGSDIHNVPENLAPFKNAELVADLLSLTEEDLAPIAR